MLRIKKIHFLVNPGDRIAQLIIECIQTPEVLECDDLEGTVRGVGGFGFQQLINYITICARSFSILFFL
jgi:dUTPase